MLARTPICVEQLAHYLNITNYSRLLSNKILKGFLYGFDLGHHGKPNMANNKWSTVPSHLEHILQEKIRKEITLGRIKGPYTDPPFKKFQVSPVSLREKSTPGTYRLIHNLSYPRNELSVNANIEQNYKSVKYANILDAIQMLSKLPLGSYSCKTDIEDGFRIIPIRESDHAKLGIAINNKYYYDTCLPMGSASSCQLFELFSTALQHIMVTLEPDCKMIHYLDDFIFFAPTEKACQNYLDVFKNICSNIGLPLSAKKTTSPATKTIFLGIELDSINRCTKLPIDKLEKYTHVLDNTARMRTITKRNLQSLIGKLAFASCAVPARAFLRRLINLLSGVKKQHHYVTLSHGAKKDIQMWHRFLESYNGITFFRTLNYYDSNSLRMGSDASKFAFGAIFQNNWIQETYPDSWKAKDITVLELYPIFVLIEVFGAAIQNCTVIFFCDNLAVVHIINSQTCKPDFLMSIVRNLVFTLVRHNIHLIARHIPGKKNYICDRLSRLQITKIDLLNAGMAVVPTVIPPHLQPDNYIA